MLADHQPHSLLPKTSVPRGSTIKNLLHCFSCTVVFFQKAVNQPDLKRPLNENKLTQIFVEQLRIQMRKQEFYIDVSNQYYDVFFGSKGIPDLYFYMPEEGASNLPLFVFEIKRLPSVSSEEREYVIGAKNNGGIQRFKNEKHAKGIGKCGIIAFVEEGELCSWQPIINGWINGLISKNAEWKSTEVLKLVKGGNKSYQMISIVSTASGIAKELHHFWLTTI